MRSSSHARRRGAVVGAGSTGGGRHEEVVDAAAEASGGLLHSCERHLELSSCRSRERSLQSGRPVAVDHCRAGGPATGWWPRSPPGARPAARRRERIAAQSMAESTRRRAARRCGGAASAHGVDGDGPRRRSGRRRGALVDRWRLGRVALDVDELDRHADAALAVGDRVVHLLHHGGPAVGQAVDHGELPERAAAVERGGRHLAGHGPGVGVGGPRRAAGPGGGGGRGRSPGRPPTSGDVGPIPSTTRRRRRGTTRLACQPGRPPSPAQGGGGLRPHADVEEDDDFDLDAHLRWVRLPAGRHRRRRPSLAVEIAATPFDRSRPLWEFTVVEGLPDGRAAMVQKIHHRSPMARAASGCRSNSSTSKRRPDRHRSTTAPRRHRPAAVGRWRSTDGRRGAAAGPTPLGAWWTRPPTSRATRSRRLAARVAPRRDRGHHPITGAPARRGRQPPLPALGAAIARSTNSRRSTSRSHDTKEAATRLGGSVNDLFVAAAAGGAGAYHRRSGVGVSELRMSMPVSTRTDRSPGGNALTPTRVLVPLDADPRTLRRRPRTPRRHQDGTGDGHRHVAGGARQPCPRPCSSASPANRSSRSTSPPPTCAPAPFDLYIAGGLMTGNYPLGPIAGTALEPRPP